MKTHHKKRLLKLIAFLRTLKPAQFDFGTVAEQRSCATVACAIGWTPAVFPKLVRWDSKEGVRLIDESVEVGSDYGVIGSHLFGISEKTSDCLFTPTLQDRFKLKPLNSYATPQEVAVMLEKWMKKGCKELAY